MDFQRPVRAVKKSFRFVPCLENIIVHGEVAFDATFYLSFPKRKGFADNPQKHWSRSFGNDSTEKEIELQQASYHLAPRALS